MNSVHLALAQAELGLAEVVLLGAGGSSKPSTGQAAEASYRTRSRTGKSHCLRMAGAESLDDSGSCSCTAEGRARSLLAAQKALERSIEVSEMGAGRQASDQEDRLGKASAMAEEPEEELVRGAVDQAMQEGCSSLEPIVQEVALADAVAQVAPFRTGCAIEELALACTDRVEVEIRHRTDGKLEEEPGCSHEVVTVAAGHMALEAPIQEADWPAVDRDPIAYRHLALVHCHEAVYTHTDLADIGQEADPYPRT